MKTILTLLLTILCTHAYNQSWDWTRVNQGSIRSIAIDPLQFVVTAQDATSSTSGRGILTKRNREGNVAWQKRFSFSGTPYVRGGAFAGVVTDNDGNIYTSNSRFDSINGAFCGTKGAICKFDFNGNLLWSRDFKWIEGLNISDIFDGGDIHSSAITKDEQDNIYVTGIVGLTVGLNFSNFNKRIIFANDTIPLSAPGSFLVVAKLDKNGNKQWIKSFSYTIPTSIPHRTTITSIVVKNNQVVLAGTSNLTTINFDGTIITGNKGTNFLTLLNATNGSVKWVKNITFNTLQVACMSGCDAPTARVLYNNKNKIVFTSAFKDTLLFGGVSYGVGHRKAYYIAQYDTSGAEEVFKLFPNDMLGNGNPTQSIPFYMPSTITAAGNGYYYHVLSHLYKLDSAYNITWISANTNPNAGNHLAIATAPSGNFIGVEGNTDGQNIVNGIDTVNVPNTFTGYSNISRVNDAYNIVSGYAFFDLNNNGLKDPGEPPASHLPIATTPGIRFPALTDSTGLYQCLTDTGSFTFAPVRTPRYHNYTPADYSITMNSFNQQLLNKNFAFTTIPGIKDMAIDIIPVTRIRPGFSGRFRVQVTNNGTVTQSGTVTLRLPNKLLYDMASPLPQSVSADSIVFAYNNMTPFTSTSFDITFKVSTTAVLGSTVTSTATVYPVANDSTVTDNYDTLQQVVTGAFDPNDKAVNLEGNIAIEKKSQALEYTIRFQNTGNDTAFNVRIDDRLSDKLDIRSFELVSSTHKVKPVIGNDRLLSFYFDHILLVDSFQNEPLSHGAVQFRIKPMPTVQVNDSITNSAAIYFDYNAPIITNTTKTKYVNLPTVNLGPDITICANSTTLNAGNTGARFVWSTGDTLQSLSVTASGTYWVRVTNSFGLSASDTITVTLKPIPVVNLGADISQCGGTVPLNAGNTGSSFLWSTGAMTQSITAGSAGTYWVRVTNANGCSATDTIAVTIQSLPVVNLGADISQCGGTAPLHAGNTGSSFLWSTGAMTQSIIAATTGAYWVRVTNTNGCSATDTIQVRINPLPVVQLSLPDTLYASDQPLLLSGTPSGGQSSGAGVSNNRFDPAIAGRGRHVLQYTYTDANGCSAMATASVVVVAPINKGGFTIYPNPNRGNFTIIQAKALRNSTLTISTPSGQVVGRYTLYGIRQQLRLPLLPGIYYLQLRAEGFAETKRMLVVR
jgi:uncharacterized repeat protein (TIGR01451 family)